MRWVRNPQRDQLFQLDQKGSEMSATLAAFGLRPIYHPTGLDRPQAIQFGIPSAFATSLFKHQPVAYNTSRQITVAANGADFVGSFGGIEWTDANGKPWWTPNWVASTTLLSGSTPVVYVFEDPNIIFEIQGDGAITQAPSNQFNFSASATIATGSALTGLSGTGVAATAVGTGVQGMLRCLDLARYVDNAWGDAFTIIQVQVARHQFTSNKVAV